MASHSALPLIAVAVLAGGVLVEANAHGGFGNWLNTFGKGTASTVGATASALGTTVSQASGQQSSSGGGKTSQSSASSTSLPTDPAALTAMAMAEGITSATDPRAYAFGRALWATQHQGDPSGYDSAGGSAQVTWNSVAIKGH